MVTYLGAAPLEKPPAEGLPPDVELMKPTVETPSEATVPSAPTEAASAEKAVPESEERNSSTAESIQPVEVPVRPWYEGPGFWTAMALGFALMAAVIGLVLNRRDRKNRSGTRKKALEEVPEEKTAPVPGKEEDYPVTKEPPRTESSQEQKAPGIRAAVVHEIGAREDQQDAWGLSPCENYEAQGAAAVLADGMGGLANGRLVSSTLVRVFLEEFQRIGNQMHPDQLLLQTAEYANREVIRILEGAERSGSTLVSAVISRGRLHFLTVGDSHIYLFRGGGLIQLNREQVYRETLALNYANGRGGLRNVWGDPQTDALVSYFGTGKLEGLDRSEGGVRLLPGDRILLCSDGIFGTLTERQMEEALSLPLEEGANRIRQLVQKANLPYQDNYTGILLEYQK